jgi:hypothetical protein
VRETGFDAACRDCRYVVVKTAIATLRRRKSDGADFAKTSNDGGGGEPGNNYKRQDSAG